MQEDYISSRVQQKMKKDIILTKEDLSAFLEADRIAMGRPKRFGLKQWLTDPIWCYMRLLRKREFLVNTKPKKGLWAVLRVVNGFRLYRLGFKLGFTIPPNTLGRGAYITHVGTVVVNHLAHIGKNAVINVDVNIGWNIDQNGAPQIGDNCYFGPGAKLFGNIVIGDNTKIGANAVVNKSFTEGNCTIVGVPARKVV